jgi:hypothetical protein
VGCHAYTFVQQSPCRHNGAVLDAVAVSRISGCFPNCKRSHCGIATPLHYCKPSSLRHSISHMHRACQASNNPNLLLLLLLFAEWSREALFLHRHAAVSQHSRHR